MARSVNGGQCVVSWVARIIPGARGPCIYNNNSINMFDVMVQDYTLDCREDMTKSTVDIAPFTPDRLA